MKAKKKSKAKWIIIVVVLAAIAAAVLYLRSQSGNAQGRQNSNIRSATAETGTITTVVSGSGILQSLEAEEVTVPTGAEINVILVEPGQRVAQGDLLATVDHTSLRSALADIQGQINSLDSQLERLKSATESSYIKAGVSGRVKAIYAAEGDSVSAAAAEYGGLMLLSLDGKMAVTLPGSAAVAVGDKVTVTLSDGSTKEGAVEKQSTNSLTVTLTDNGPAVGDTVTVTAQNGTALGSGTLEVNSPLVITGYRGVIDNVLVKENSQVYTSTNLFQLTNLDHTPEYEQLLSQRQELADDLRKLLLLEQNGYVTAPLDGTIQTAELKPVPLLTIAPDDFMTVSINVDELDILSIQLGQEAAVTVGALGDEPVAGTVTAVSTQGTSSNGVTRYAVEVTLPKTERMLAGMNASVEIVIGRAENCLTIPEDALNQSGANTFVYTDYDPETGALSGETAVTTGASDGVRVEIVSGLTEGTSIYYRYVQPEDNAGRLMPW